MQRPYKWLPLLLTVGPVFLAELALLWLHATYHHGLTTGIQDSAGNRFGFGERITWDLLMKASPGVGFPEMLAQMHAFNYWLLAGLLGATACLWPNERNPLFRWRRHYVAAQLVLFPLGWLGMLLLIFLQAEFAMTGAFDLDGETVEEILTPLLTHGLWIAVSLSYLTYSFLAEKTARDCPLIGPPRHAPGL